MCQTTTTAACLFYHPPSVIIHWTLNFVLWRAGMQFWFSWIYVRFRAAAAPPPSVFAALECGRAWDGLLIDNKLRLADWHDACKRGFWQLLKFRLEGSSFLFPFATTNYDYPLSVCWMQRFLLLRRCVIPFLCVLFYYCCLFWFQRGKVLISLEIMVNPQWFHF